MFQFQQFPVYIKAKSLFKDIQPIIINNKVSTYLRDQLDRASSSILLNIAEGAGKYSLKDKKNYYVIARGSVNECVAILEIIFLKKLIKRQEYLELEDNLISISKMLTGLIKKLISLKT